MEFPRCTNETAAQAVEGLHETNRCTSRKLRGDEVAGGSSPGNDTRSPGGDSFQKLPNRFEIGFWMRKSQCQNAVIPRKAS